MKCYCNETNKRKAKPQQAYGFFNTSTTKIDMNAVLWHHMRISTQKSQLQQLWSSVFEINKRPLIDCLLLYCDVFVSQHGSNREQIPNTPAPNLILLNCFVILWNSDFLDAVKKPSEKEKHTKRILKIRSILLNTRPIKMIFKKKKDIMDKQFTILYLN